MRTNIRDTFSPEQRAAWRPHFVARNTVEFNRDGKRVIRLHKTDVVTFEKNGVRLNSGGWRTVTTKDRMNRFMPGGYSVFSMNGFWYVGSHTKFVAFFDGIRVPQDVDKPKRESARAARRELRLKKQIKKFLSKLDGSRPLPLPNAGDCFLCQFKSDNADHLLSHVQEGYLHGSLIMRALEAAGYRDPLLIFQMEQNDRARGRKPQFVKRALRRFLYRRLGLAA